MRNKLILFILFFSLIIFPSISLAQSDYPLPYPGILPDHPLYPLKLFRDKIYDFLLSDPLKKAEFKLLMADKRMFMSIMLKDKGKPELAEQTVSEASKYYGEGVLTLHKAGKAGRDVDPLRDKMINASEKYQEILVGFQKSFPENLKAGLQGSLERIIKYRNELIEKDKNMQRQADQ